MNDYIRIIISSLIKMLVLLTLFFSLAAYADEQQSRSYIDGDFRFTEVETYYLESYDLREALKNNNYFKPIKYDPRNGIFEAVLFYVEKKPNLNLNESIRMQILCDPSESCVYKEHPIRGNSVWKLRSDGIEPFVKLNKKWLKQQGETGKIIRIHSSDIAITNKKIMMYPKIIGDMPDAMVGDYAMLITTYYVRNKNYGNAPRFLDSSKSISAYRAFGVSVPVLIFALMLLLKIPLAPRKTMTIGAFLTVLALIQVVVWDVNYMVIGMGLIASAGMLLIFGNGIGKLIYLIGFAVIAYVSADKYGATSIDFFYSIGLLTIIGVFLFFLEENDYENSDFDYIDDNPTNIAEKNELNAEIRNNATDSNSINYESAASKIRIIVLGLFFILMLVTMIL